MPSLTTPSSVSLKYFLVIIEEMLTLDGNDDGVFGIERDENNKEIISIKKRLDREQGGLHVLSIKCFEPSDNNIRNLRKPYDKMVSGLH